MANADEAIGAVFVFAIVAAWATSLITSLGKGEVSMLLLGLFIPPAGVVHGVAVWLGLA